MLDERPFREGDPPARAYLHVGCDDRFAVADREPVTLDGEAEAKLIAMRLGRPPAGYGHWTLQLLADEMVALEIVDTISHETVRQVLKKWDDEAKD